jgi:uncharacterized delta-60 repeat protein
VDRSAVGISFEIAMKSYRRRAALVLTLVIASAGLAVFACTGEDVLRTAAGDVGTGTGNDGPSSATDGDPQGGDMTVEVTPAAPEALVGGTVKVHVKVGGTATRAGTVKVALAAGATDAGVSPLSFDKALLDLPPELPEGDVVVTVDATSRHGSYPINVVATGTAQGGAPLEGKTAAMVRVVGKPGQLDTAAGDGKGYVDFCPFAQSVACAPGDLFVYPDGRILLVASTYETGGSPTDKFLAARFLADGSLDPTFGTAGLVWRRVGNISAYSNAELAPMSNGSFVVAFTGGGKVAYARMSADGVIDESWGTDGGVESPLLSGDTTGGRIAPTATGFLIAGSLPVSGGSAGAVEAHLANGMLDPGFGDGGTVTFKVTSSTYGSSLVVDDTKNRVVVGGEDYGASSTATQAILVGLTSNGAIDDGFGAGITGCGPSFTEGCTPNKTATTTQDGVKGVVKYKNGYMAIAGFSSPSIPASVKVFHVGATGGTGSFPMIVVDAGGDAARPGALVVQPDDFFLVATGVQATTFFILRYGADGNLDPTFGTGGQAQSIPGYVRRLGFLEQGRELVAIGYEAGGQPRAIRIARYWLR